MASHPITLTRKELYEKVWSQPVNTLAKEYGISDVGLKKICKRRDIPTPGLGYCRDTEKKRLEDQLNAVIVGFVRMAAGLRAHALKEAIERRQNARAERRRREEERRREELERNIAHLQKGMERWQWRQTAKEFLGTVRTEARRRSLDKEVIDEWLAWADAYIDQRGLEGFFDRWRLSEAKSSNAKLRRQPRQTFV